MMRLLFNLVFVFCIIAESSSQELFSHRTLQAQRAVFASTISDSIAQSNKATAISHATVAGLAWRIAAFNRYEEARQSIATLKRMFDELSEAEQYAVISLLYDRKNELSSDELYRMTTKAKSLKTSRLISLSIEHRVGGENPDMYELNESQFEQLKQITLRRGIPVLLLRADRDLPGVMVVPQEENASPVTLSYLGRSAYNTPPQMTNGNTPCGVYAIDGWEVSENVFIGPTPSLITRLPFEVGADRFGADSKVWSESFYQSLFPEQLRKIDMIWQAYRAGENGRSEIVVHGSTIDPEFFAGAAYYPLTPSMGCMTAMELWDPTTGQLMEGGSDQMKLFRTLPVLSKFIYVVQVKQQVISQYQ